MIRRRAAFRPSTSWPDLLKAGSGPVSIIARIKKIIKESTEFVKRKNGKIAKGSAGFQLKENTGFPFSVD